MSYALTVGEQRATLAALGELQRIGYPLDATQTRLLDRLAAAELDRNPPPMPGQLDIWLKGE